MKHKTLAKLMLIVLAGALVLVGCSSNNGTAADPGASNGSNAADQTSGGDKASSTTDAAQQKLDPVTLKIMLPGTEPKDFKEVVAEAENRMSDTLNVKLDVTWVAWPDLNDKLRITLAAGDDYDLIFDTPGVGYKTKVLEGNYEPLDDLLKQYGPEILKARPQQMWDANKANGAILAIPLANSYYKGWGFAVRKDLREKLGLSEIKSLDDMVEFGKALKKSNPDMVPMVGPAVDAQMPLVKDADIRAVAEAGLRQDVLYYKNNDGKIYNLFETSEPLIMNMLKQYRQMYQDGLIYPDIMGLKDFDAVVTSGKGAEKGLESFLLNDSMNRALQKNVPGASLEYATFLDPSWKKVSDFSAGNFIAIPKASKHKERAIQFLNWANMKENYDLLAYGIEGKHWIAVGNDKYQAGPNAADYGSFQWAWIMNPVNDRMNAGQSDLSQSMIKWSQDPNHFEKNILTGISYDLSGITNDIAQFNTLVNKYWKPMSYGVLDVDSTFAKFKEDAGPIAKRIQEELQKQADAFMKK